MTTGVRQRHSRNCNRKARCDCPWQASVYSKRDGKKIRQMFPSRAAATAWREDKLRALKRGELRAPVATTVRQAGEGLLAGARDGSIPTVSGDRYKPATIRGYKVSLDKRILPAMGDLRLTEVHRRDVQDLADRLTDEGFSASTVQNTLDPLRVIFRRAIRREEVIAVDPTEGLELRRPVGTRERIAAPDEAAALIAVLPDAERALWATAFYAGLRRGELQALRWSDVDLAGRVIRVTRGWDAIEGEQDVKSAAGKRRVPILEPLVRELVGYKARAGRDGDALVFGPTGVRPFSPETVRRHSLTAWGWKEVPNPKAERPKMVWIKARDDAAESITLHEGRHTCASILIAAGVNAKALSVIMGHSTITMTFDTYGHLLPGGLDEVAAATNAYLAKLAQKSEDKPEA
jgi:integrase